MSSSNDDDNLCESNHIACLSQNKPSDFGRLLGFSFFAPFFKKSTLHLIRHNIKYVLEVWFPKILIIPYDSTKYSHAIGKSKIKL